MRKKALIKSLFFGIPALTAFITFARLMQVDSAKTNIEDLESAVQIDQNDTEAKWLFEEVRQNEDKEMNDIYDQAIENFSAVLKIKPDNQNALYKRGFAYFRNGNYDQAIEDFSAILKIKPDNQNALYFRGLAYRLKNNYDRAIEDFNVAIQIKPDDHQALTDRGLAYVFKGDYDQAIEDISTAIKIKPDYHIALYHRGFAYY